MPKKTARSLVVTVAAATAATVSLTVATTASAAEAGDVIVVDNIGVPMWTHNFDTGKDFGVGDKLLISEFMGAHYYVTDKIRVGMMFQWTEQYTGALPPGADRWSTFALLPQVGWNFYDHFSAAAIFTYAPRAGGKDQLDLGIQGLIGYSLPINKVASFNALVEIPYNFHLARTIGITPLVGLTLHL